MSAEPKNGREALRVRFSEAAKGVTELYRDAVVSYDAGYRDALLHVHRYVLLAVQSATASTGTSSHNGQQHVRTEFTPPQLPPSPPSLDAGHLLRFIQSTLKRRDALAAASRSVVRRRKRSSSRAERTAHGVCREDDRSTPYRRLQPPVAAVEKPGDLAVGDMLRDVHITPHAESDSGTTDDEDFAAML
ncbi:hypothetical protein DQ04_08881010 [Trypanosoma grayi]|uniref:hypothetical protein n=1 Tax=Trypanosoma grayi TaxID=71804 RepID=UPI0004F4483E|nr:hypothetical protein DQ04_08881010 [Trypanosoma grayi]KEG07766.1 hypothetical protein DQ04_08881010 [Trypanosoma grayi]